MPISRASNLNIPDWMKHLKTSGAAGANVRVSKQGWLTPLAGATGQYEVLKARRGLDFKFAPTFTSTVPTSPTVWSKGSGNLVKNFVWTHRNIAPGPYTLTVTVGGITVAWATANANTGAVTFNGTTATLGATQAVVVTVADVNGNFDSQSFTLTVNA